MDDLKKGLSGFKKSAQKQMAKVTGKPPPPDEEQGLLQDLKGSADECCGTWCKLTRKQRLYGFAYSLIGGIICSSLGVMMYGMGNTLAFAILYSCGTIASLCSSLFLWGPWHQIKNMMKETRLICTIVMLLSIGCTLFLALYFGKKYVGLVLLSCVVQFLAVTWYGLSYIPYARTVAKKCIKSTLGM